MGARSMGLDLFSCFHVFMTGVKQWILSSSRYVFVGVVARVYTERSTAWGQPTPIMDDHSFLWLLASVIWLAPPRGNMLLRV
jgi:hypothetical protein